MSVMSNIGKPDPLGAILDRLNGTVVKVNKLRQSLDDLETELSEIRQLCEDEIRTRTVAKKSSSTAVTVATAVRIPSDPVSTSIPHVSAESSLVFQGPGPRMPAFDSLRTAAVCRPPRPPKDLFPFPEDIDLSSYPSELKREGDCWFALSNPLPKVKRVLDVHLVHDLVHDYVHCIRFSPDGRWLAVGSLTAAHIYDVNTGVEICILDHAGGYVWSVCFSPNGKYLGTALSRDIRARPFSAGSGELSTDSKPKSIYFLFNGNQIWDINEKQIHSIFKGHQDFVSCLHFSPNGQFIVSGSHDGSVRIWDVDGNRPVKVLTIDDHYSLEERRVLSLTISPDGKYVAVGSKDTVVRMFEVTTGVLVQRLRGHRDGVPSVAFTPDGSGLISGSWDCTLKYWDVSGLHIRSDASTAIIDPLVLSSSPCLMNLTGHECVSSMAVSRDCTWAVSTTSNGKLVFWDMTTGVAQCMVSGQGVYYVDLSPMDNFLATASSVTKRVRIWSYGGCS